MALVMPSPSGEEKEALAKGLADFEGATAETVLAPPHRVYSLELGDLKAEKPIIDSAKDVGWRFLTSDKGLPASAEVGGGGQGITGTGGSKMKSLARGSRIAAILEALQEVEGLDQVKAQDYELRALRIAGLHLEAIWLKALAGQPDLIFPFFPSNSWRPLRLYTIPEFLDKIQPMLTKQLQFMDTTPHKSR